ncbi:MAG: replication-associated recombination protein A [Candidatus Kerfeldbacteria bacterium]|nr:replication-associated recombination protein A [Candidatus Kerfeldbacteria bacterium]
MIKRLLTSGQLVSLIFWGPPGTGKTTLAHIIANSVKAKFIPLSAVTAGVKELRVIIDQAKSDRLLHGEQTILFIDEIHRWNKSQQDALLPHIEQGTVTLIGATTENPSFEVNSALLSRCQVVVFDKLDEVAVLALVNKAAVPMSDELKQFIVMIADGDGRTALNTVEMLQRSYGDLSKLTRDEAKQAIEKVALRYDKAGEEHYNIISALHKTMRASDVNGAVYWCGRMLFAGEDPLYVMRRVVEFASEDIGNTDPQALILCQAAYQTVHALGMPEGQYAIFQAVAYCAQAKKSRAVYDAAKAVEQDIRETPNSPVPMHLRNAPTRLMKQLGYGKQQGQSNLPEHLQDKTYYAV